MKMINRFLLTIAIFAASLCGVNTATAQITIKIPKLPKTEKPKSEPPKSDNGSPSPSQPGQTQNKTGYPKFDYNGATNVPKFLRNTIEITVKTESLNDVSKWIPKVRFDSYYDQSSKLRYAAEWFKADGSPWFTEQLDASNDGREYLVDMQSPYSDPVFQANSIAALGTYSLKVTDTKTGAVIFQGKFKVGKLPLYPDDPKKKSAASFYVDNDWSLPIGYVGFDFDNWHSDQLNPSVFLWFKGTLDTKDFEARLFYNNQMVASTDDGGYINSQFRRGEDCFLNREICSYTLWKFNWNNFILESNDYGRGKYPSAIFTRDKPGEYTAKIFHKGVQVRELKFTIDSNGFITTNPYSDQVPMIYGGTAVPVKITGTLEKWNTGTNKNDAFYGNPLIGFTVQ